MIIRVTCPQCETRIDSGEREFGSSCRCPKCSTQVGIPGAHVGPGVTVGGFEIIGSLGKGGMGEVFLANQLNMNRQVALKVLPGRMTRDKDGIRRFLHEARMSARLEHPHVVTVIDAGEDAGFYYLAMHYVRGESLEEKLEREGRFSEEDGLGYMLRIFEVLDFSWRHHRVLHRDIKPANIMIDHYGEIRLLDMGLAKDLLEEKSLTVAGSILGTPYYMSPEQASGDKLDFHTDMYSSAATLFRLLTGDLLFDGEGPVNIMAKHMFEEPPSVKERNPDISDATAQLINHMLQKEPADRPADYEEVITKIRAILAGDLCVAFRARPSVFKRRVRRNLCLVGLLILSGIMSFGILRTAVLHSQYATDERVVDKVGSVREAKIAPQIVGQQKVIPEEVRTQKLQVRYDDLLAVTHRGDVPTSVLIKEYQFLANDCVGTSLEEPILSQLDTLQKLQLQELEAELEQITDEFERILSTGKPYKAIKYLKKLKGLVTARHSAELNALRQRAYASLQSHKAAREAKTAEKKKQAIIEQREQELGEFYAAISQLEKQIAGRLLAQDYRTAMKTYLDFIEKKETSDFRDLIPKYFPELDVICRSPHDLAQTFCDSIGKKFRLPSNGKQELYRVDGVDGELILASLMIEHGTIRRKVPISDIPAEERIRRLGELDTDAKRIIKALILYEAGEQRLAQEAIKDVKAPFALALFRDMKDDIHSRRQYLLKLGGLPLDEDDPSLLIANFRSHTYTSYRADRLEREAILFIEHYGKDPEAAKLMPLVELMSGIKAPIDKITGMIIVPASRIDTENWGDGAAKDLKIQEAFAARHKLQIELSNGVGMHFRLIPTGASWGYAGKSPSKPFYFGKFEVTNMQWAAVMGEMSTNRPDSRPVFGITPSDVDRFLTKLCSLEGVPKGTYRLPTDAEWKYACQANTTTRWFFGNDVEQLYKFGNYLDRMAHRNFEAKDKIHSDGYAKLAPIGKYAPNPWGLYDMYGNVAEYIQAGALADPPSGASVQWKGGAWSHPAQMMYAERTQRDVMALPEYRKSFIDRAIGIRVVREFKPRSITRRLGKIRR